MFFWVFQSFWPNHFRVCSDVFFTPQPLKDGQVIFSPIEWPYLGNRDVQNSDTWQGQCFIGCRCAASGDRFERCGCAMSWCDLCSARMFSGVTFEIRLTHHKATWINETLLFYVHSPNCAIDKYTSIHQLINFKTSKLSVYELMMPSSKLNSLLFGSVLTLYLSVTSPIPLYNLHYLL